MFNLKQMLEGDVSRLRWVKRFGTCHVSHQESVAEHSYYTALYAMFIAEWLVDNNVVGVKKVWAKPNTLVGACCQRALLHDLDEALTGDFPRPFKYHSAELKRMLDDASEGVAQRMFVSVCPKVPTANRLFLVWKGCKDKSLPGRIVSFSDFLAALGFLVLESLHHVTVQEHRTTILGYFHEFRHEDYALLTPLVDQAEEIMEVLKLR